MRNKHIVVFVTCASKKEAARIAKKLLNEKLIACANIIEGVRSFFWWEGRIEKALESLMIIKSAKKNFTRIKRRVKELHSYKVPEIIAMPITEGEKNFLKWIDASIEI